MFKTPRIIKWLYPSLVWNGAKDRPSIFLTFDDGPVSGVSNEILDVLAVFGVKATFFCVGENIERYPELFVRMYREGHMIGNHTYHHLNGWKVRDEEYIADIGKCHDTMEKNGFKTKQRLFRPPYGKIWRSVIRSIGKDYKIIMWDVLSYDFSELPKEKLLNRCKKHLTSGSIIVFHDSLKTKAKTAFLIYQLIGHLIKQGYNFSTLDKLFLSD